MYTFSEINDATGFANGDLFASEAQVREYFTLPNMRDMFGSDWTLAYGSDYDCYQGMDEDQILQAMLERMAETVIAHGWHMVSTYEGGRK